MPAPKPTMPRVTPARAMQLKAATSNQSNSIIFFDFYFSIIKGKGTPDLQKHSQPYRKWFALKILQELQPLQLFHLFCC